MTSEPVNGSYDQLAGFARLVYPYKSRERCEVLPIRSASTSVGS